MAEMDATAPLLTSVEVVFDVQSDHDNVQISQQMTGQVIYTLQKRKDSYCSRGVLTLHRGPLLDSQSENDAAFAEIYGNKVSIIEYPDTPPTVYKRKEFLYKNRDKGFLQPCDEFMCNGRQYIFRSTSYGKTLELYSLAALDTQPLAIFRRQRTDPDKGTIRILPGGYSDDTSRSAQSLTSESEKRKGSSHALLRNGCPTSLFDLALVAEHMYRQQTRHRLHDIV